jgi:hypothetical protein
MFAGMLVGLSSSGRITFEKPPLLFSNLRGVAVGFGAEATAVGAEATAVGVEVTTSAALGAFVIKVGAQSMASLSVSLVCAEPSAFITYIS